MDKNSKVLALKYRPQNFEDLIGQEVTSETIINSIKAMENVRDNLLKAKNNLKIANNKSEDLSIKKLTKGNPTMIAKFNVLREQD